MAVLIAVGGLLPARAAAAAPGPDLEAVSISLPVSQVTPGASYLTSTQIRNAGDMPVFTSWTDAIILSVDDSTLEPTDFLAGIRPGLPPLNPGMTYTFSPIPVSIPEEINGVPLGPGVYTLFLVADFNKTLAESNESNNVVSTTVTVGSPDLVAASLTAPEFMAIKVHAYQPSVSITNNGAAPTASAFRSEFTLSDNATLGDSDDLAIGAFGYQSSIASGQTIELQPSLIIPPNATAGTKTLFLTIDDVDGVPELDETNNVISRPVTVIAPDLVPANLIGAPAAMAPGETTNIGWTVANQGTYGVPGVQVGNAWDDVLRLSTDATWQTSDLPLRHAGHAVPFDGVSFDAAPGPITIPVDTPVGAYFLILHLDVHGEVFEGANGESNNTLAVPITIGNAPVVDAGGPYAVIEGGTIALSGSATDADSDPLTFAWDLDGDGSYETPGSDVSFSAGGLDGPDSATIRLKVCDPLELCRTAETGVQIENAPPTATLLVDPAIVSPGGSFSLSLADGADPSAADIAAGLTYAFDCGAGFAADSAANSTTCVAGSDAGVLTVHGRVTDKDSGATEYLAEVTVEPAQPAYGAAVNQPINADGTSVFSARRGVVPVKFSLSISGTATCELAPATIAITRTGGDVIGSVNESVFSSGADSGGAFRISDCQYHYNVDARSLGAGTYRVDILINGVVVGSATFELK
jgi:hypothetical protein